MNKIKFVFFLTVLVSFCRVYSVNIESRSGILIYREYNTFNTVYQFSDIEQKNSTTKIILSKNQNIMLLQNSKIKKIFFFPKKQRFENIMSAEDISFLREYSSAVDSFIKDYPEVKNLLEPDVLFLTECIEKIKKKQIRLKNRWYPNIESAIADNQFDRENGSYNIIINKKIFLNLKIIKKDWFKGITVSHNGGIETIAFENFSDENLKLLGLPTKSIIEELKKNEIAKKQKEEKEKRKFDKDQQDKGLVKYEGKWITQEELKKENENKQEQEFINKAREIILRKAPQTRVFKIIQVLDYGSICQEYKFDNYYGFYPTDRAFFLYGATKDIIAEGDLLQEKLYWSGTYTYTNINGFEKTINSFSVSMDFAVEIVRLKFKLYANSDNIPEQDKFFEKSKNFDLKKKFEDDNIKAFGSGFVITEDGYVVTNYHVIEKSKKILIISQDGKKEGSEVTSDPDNDLTILKMEGSNFTPVEFADDRIARLGETVFTVGFPVPELQGFSPKVTKGIISSLSGLQDDVRMYQIDAAVQPGNSGGPLANEKGNIIGIVSARINDLYVLGKTGSNPQNVNYAIKKSYLLALIDSNPKVSEKIKVKKIQNDISFEEAVEKVKKATVLIVVY